MTADQPPWKRALNLLHHLEDALIALLLLGMLGLAITQIIMRELLHSGLPWIDPLLRIAVLWLGLLGALLATRLDRHIEINLISHWV
ncbi:MAG: TRAP transporter small permease subunit, partial [Gammaproteobacteria bacterium]